MKHLASLLIAASIAITSNGFAAGGKLGPYLHDYDSTPVSAPVSALDPSPGATVVNTVTGLRYDKISAGGDNSTYTTREVVFASNTLTFTGTSVQTFAVAVLPGTMAFIPTSASVLTVTGTMTTAPTMLIQSGTGTLLSGTTTMTGLTPNTATKVTTADPTKTVTTGTLELRTITSGTGAITARAFIRGFFVP